MPENPVVGFVFYPGGKVEYSAYKPLMEACASRGIACVIVKMPFNLAVFDVNGAEGITDMYPEISEWYIGGHSLGGSMAASYISENSDEYKGLVLLGSYSTADLSEKKIEVLSVFGSEDKVMNKEKYNESKINLPANFEEVIIEGGCHAYFGMYGA
jgi:pimeloyl-ACP methyl ester carboxylesterase